MDKQTVAVIGPGSWGTALSQVLHDNGHEVRIWGNVPEQIDEINQEHTNKRYFKDVLLDPGIKAYHDLNEALSGVDAVLFVVPTKVTRLVAKQVAELLDHPVKVMHASKGLEPNSHKRISQILEEEIPASLRSEIVVVSGPSHAEEVVIRMLTTICAVSLNEEDAKTIQKLFSNDYLRVYRGDDEIGSETGVALKNAIAVASGVLYGLGYGDNTRAALITRGLAEMIRYGVAMGGRKETFMGMTGIGDLIVTCTSKHSRNFQAGYDIGKHNSAKYFWDNNTKTVEGVRTAKVVHDVAHEKGIDMPIIEEIYKVLYEDKDPKESAKDLMLRDLKHEMI